MRWRENAIERRACAEGSTFRQLPLGGTSCAPPSLSGEPTTTTQLGRQNMTLTVSKMSGVFPAFITGNTSYVVVQMRPLAGIDCPALDFKWALQ